MVTPSLVWHLMTTPTEDAGFQVDGPGPKALGWGYRAQVCVKLGQEDGLRISKTGGVIPPVHDCPCGTKRLVLVVPGVNPFKLVFPLPPPPPPLAR
jgi:hypothetical protein